MVDGRALRAALEGGMGVENKEQEGRIAMTLARRAYVCGMFHTLFGGGVDKAFATQLFSRNTQEALAWLDELVCADTMLANKRVGVSGRTLGACVKEAISCVDQHVQDEDVADAVQIMQDDYPKLFQVPGDAYVRPWESPYINADGMLFRGSTLDVRSYYHDAGLKLQAEKHFPDDHIAAMMDYLVRMCQRAYEAFADGDDVRVVETLRTQSDFMRKHVLTWVDAFADKVIQNDTRAYYAAFAGAMAAFAHVDEACAQGIVVELSAKQ